MVMTKDRNKDIYSEITNTIIAELEKGVLPWAPNWDSRLHSRPMRSNDEPYRGINVLLLWMAGARAGYHSCYWFTYRQVKEMGGFVRKGEKATSVVYCGSMTKLERDDKGEEKERQVPFLRQYAVFNLNQTEEMPERFHWPTNDLQYLATEQEGIEIVDQFFRNTGAEIAHGTNVPHYSILSDRVHMPARTAFKSMNDYFAVLAHEVTHWTGHPTRCPRNFRAIVGSPANYAREELVAELGAAFLCADLELSMQPRADHAEYIAIWLEVLRNDKRAIFQASSMAQKAIDFLHGLQRSQPTENPERTAA
jgi:antirestriction protein ArdC